VTPGLLGFLLTAFIVVLTALLIVDMVRRIRRVRYRAQVEEERMAAAEAADVARDDNAGIADDADDADNADVAGKTDNAGKSDNAGRTDA
jgi:uncharacterized membrane protein YcjF (UPF0283 family)